MLADLTERKLKIVSSLIYKFQFLWFETVTLLQQHQSLYGFTEELMSKVPRLVLI